MLELPELTFDMGQFVSMNFNEEYMYKYPVYNKNEAEESVDLDDVYQFFRKYSTQNNDSKVVIPKAEFDVLKYKLGKSIFSHTKEGPRHDYPVSNKNKAEESDDLYDVYQFFRKYSTQKNDSKVVIPKAEYDLFEYTLEVALCGRTTIQEKEIQDPTHTENSKRSLVYLLNTSENLPAKSFSNVLQDHLHDMSLNVKMITASDVLDIDLENILMIICNKVDRDTPQQAVDRCLGSIKENHYASTILIMLHVTRKPPRSRTQRLLLSSDHYEKYKRIGMVVDMAFNSKQGIYDCDKNKEAFSELFNFLCDYNSTHTGKQLVAEKRKMGTSESCASNASNVDRQYCSESDKWCKKNTEWRILYEGNGWDENYHSKLLKDIQNNTVNDGTVENIRMLLVGPVFSGKTSFLDTVASIDIGRLTSLGLQYHFMDCLPSYKPRLRLKNFELFDSSCSRKIKDIKYVVNGNVPPDMKSVEPIDEESAYFKKYPHKQDKIHCIIVVIDADRVTQYSNTQEPIKEIKDLQEILTKTGVPKIMLLTKIDRLCDMIESDITHCYKCEHVMKAVHQVLELIEIPACNVFPVQNYSVEWKTDPKLEILPLLAVREMIFLGMDYVQCLQDDEEISPQFDVTDTMLEENSASNNCKESYNNQELDELHVIPENKTEIQDVLPKSFETETQADIDYINFHEFNGIFF